MSTPSIPDETLIETVASYRAHGDNQSAAARSLGIARETLQNRLRRAAERGLMGTRETLPGYAIRQITDTPQGQYIQQRKEHGEEWRPTDGLVIKGKTSLLDAEGRIITQHVMERADSKKADLLGAITAALADHVPAAPLPAPPHTRADIITVYPVADLHLGLYAWARETGASYDVEIAAGLLRSAVQNLVGRAAPSEAAIILDLGDYFHTDSSRNQTARSANPLDVDTRYARVLRIGYELVVDAIELALQKHERVIYRKLPGNHDDETSLMLAIRASR
jgi:transposase-like protein